MSSSKNYDMDELRHIARGNWVNIISSLVGTPISFLDKKQKACPICGPALCGPDSDRFTFDDKNGDGSWMCRKVHGSGDGFEFVKKALNISLNEAVNLVGEFVTGNKLQGHEPAPETSRWAYAGPLTDEQIAAIESKNFIAWNPKKELTPDYNGSRLRPELVSIYKTYEGVPVGAVVRVVINGKKITPTICNGTNGSETRLVMMAMPSPKPLLGSQFVSGEKPVLIVEGEKTWQAVRDNMPGWEVLTWGGSSTYKKADWSILHGIDCFIWPDNDAAGLDAATEIAAILRAKQSKVTIIKPPLNVPEAWDLADAFEQGWTSESVAQYISEYISENNKSVAVCGNDVIHQDPSANPLTLVFNWVDTKSNGKPLGTIENFRIMVQTAGVTIKYNMISNRVEIFVPGAYSVADLAQNAAYADIISIAARNHFPVGNVKDFILKVAAENQYNPIEMWLRSRPWDGVDRISQMCQTLPCKNADLRDMFVKKWLIGATALATSVQPMSMHGVLVLKGGQGIGKTTWVRKLLPPELSDYIATGRTINPDQKDTLFPVLSRWIVELGEVGTTMRKADADKLKAFLTDDKDILRKAYEAHERETPRRTIFVASTNEERFLHDDTGSRRYWVLDLDGEIDNKCDIDRQQLFAQALHLHEAGEPHWINAEEQVILEDSNDNYKELCPIAELLSSKLDFDTSAYNHRWATVTEILQSCGIAIPDKQQVRRASLYLSKRGCQRDRKHGKNLIWAPLTTSETTSF